MTKIPVIIEQSESIPTIRTLGEAFCDATDVIYVAHVADVLPWLEPFINPCNIDV